MHRLSLLPFAIVVALLASGCGGQPATEPTIAIHYSQFTPGVLEVPVGRPVTFTLRDLRNVTYAVARSQRSSISSFRRRQGPRGRAWAERWAVPRRSAGPAAGELPPLWRAAPP